MILDVLNIDDKVLIKGKKRVLTPLIKDNSFKKTLKKAIQEFNTFLVIFVEANGYEIEELEQNQTNLNELFSSNEHYKEFITKYITVQQGIESAQYIGENPIYMQRKLNMDISELRNFIKKLYPDYKPKHKVVSIKVRTFSIIKKTIFFTILSFLLVLLGFTGYILFQEFFIRL